MQSKQIKLHYERKNMYINDKFFMYVENLIKVPNKSEFIFYGTGKTFLIDKETLANNLFCGGFSINKEGQILNITFH